MGTVKLILSLNDRALSSKLYLTSDSSFSFINWSLRRVGKPHVTLIFASKEKSSDHSSGQHSATDTWNQLITATTHRSGLTSTHPEDGLSALQILFHLFIPFKHPLLILSSSVMTSFSIYLY